MIEDIGKVDIALDYFISKLNGNGGSAQNLIQHFQKLGDLKSYVAVLEAKKFLEMPSNIEKVDEALQIYPIFMAELVEGADFDTKKGHFTMYHLFLDVMYRIYAESFVKLRQLGKQRLEE